MNLLGPILPNKLNILIYNFFLGLLLALSFDPFKIPFASVIAIGLYFLVNDYVFKKFPGQYQLFFYNGVFFGFGFFLLSMYWVSNSIIEFDKNLSFIAPVILICFPIGLSFFFGLMQLVSALVWSNTNSKLFYFSSIWIIFEFLRSSLFTGLPWNLIGYSWSWSMSFSQSISIFGTYGLGLLTVFCSVSIFSIFLNKKNKIFFAVAVVTLITLYLYGTLRINNHQISYSDNELRILHTYFDQKDKWTKKSIDQVANMGSLEVTTLFPETSFGFNSNGPKNWIVGYIRNDKKNNFNSINYMGYTYDKKILVPFGEYFPLSNLANYLFPKNKFFKNNLSKGAEYQVFPSNYTPLICYEVIFPSFVRSSISNDTNLILNISNDGWFGNFSGPKQHFTHAQFRSIELGIPIARSSNKGISGLIGPMGEIINTINSKKLSYLDVKIPKKLKTTIYRKYGNLLTYFLIVLFFIIGYAMSSKKIRAKYEQ